MSTFTPEHLQRLRGIVESGTPLARNTVLQLIDRAAQSDQAEKETTPPGSTPPINLRDYIRRDLAYAHGIDRDTLAELDKKPKHDRSPTHRQWDIYADKAKIAAIDWIAGNAPGAIPHLQAAGLYIFTPDETENE